MKFFGDRRAAHLRAAFEHERLESGFGQIEGGDQAVVSATDNDHIACFSHVVSGKSGSLSVFENFECCETSGSTHDAAARVGGGTAQIKILDGRSEGRPARNRSQKEELFQGELALEDVALSQAPFAFKVKRCHD